MFDDAKKLDLQEPDKPAPAPFNWALLTVQELVQFRDEITRALPPLSIKEMNLEEEMLLQFHSLRALQNQVLDVDELPLNQRAQVANACAGSLAQLLSLQEKVYTQERFKRIENLLIRNLSRLPEEQAGAFLNDYEKIIASK